MQRQPHGPTPDPFRPYFLAAGVLAGIVFSALYLYALQKQALTSPAVTPDPWFKRLFFVLLIFFACFFQASLLSRLFSLFVKWIRKP